MTELSTQAIRDESMQVVRKLGYTVNENLPLLDIPHALRETNEIIDRALVLYCVVAVANRSSSEAALAWLGQERLLDKLTAKERRWMERSSERDRATYLAREEALWALMWALGFVESLDFSEYCQSALAGMFPRVRDRESSTAFRGKGKLRSLDEIVAATDVAYCLHWSIRNISLEGQSTAGKMEPYVIIERRRALEWLLSTDAWDDVPLDT